MQWFKVIFFVEIILASLCASEIIFNETKVNSALLDYYLNKISKQQQVSGEPRSILEKTIPSTGEMGTEQIFGGPMQQDPSDPEYYKLAEESLAEYSKSSETKQHYKPTEITEVFTQIVAGLLTTINFEASPTNCKVNSHGHPISSECAIQNKINVLRCTSVILETPWLASKDIGVKCNPVGSHRAGDEYDHDKAEFITQENQSLNGLTPNDAGEPEFFQVAEDSLAKYIASSGMRKHYKPTEIIKVTSQKVDSGLITRIYFKAAATYCEVDSTGRPDSSNCEEQIPKDVLLCNTETFDPIWFIAGETKISCRPNVTKFETISKVSRASDIQSSWLGGQGGQSVQDVNDPKYFKLAEKSLAKYIVSFGIRKHYKPTEIIKVTTQVVSGLLTRIDFKASANNCEDCEIIYCQSEIWEQPWLNNKDNIKISCTPHINRKFNWLVY